MIVTQTSQFKKDIRSQLKRGKDLQKLKDIIDLLIVGNPLPPKNRDHPLTGNWSGWRDCHLEPDWLLIYKISPGELILARTGTHSDLF
ncbi:MAG: putative addiction module toxin, RelE/StbE family [Verrucomicrobiales bacterium]|nr:putative addiction module toxin, RelE/StbE family [Verrucomicrobiales bacterium]